MELNSEELNVDEKLNGLSYRKTNERIFSDHNGPVVCNVKRFKSLDLLRSFIKNKDIYDATIYIYDLWRP